MIHPEIDWDTCQSCNPCLARQACRMRAIVKLEIDEPPYIDHARCNNCVSCVNACPWNAINMHTFRSMNKLGV